MSAVVQWTKKSKNNELQIFGFILVMSTVVINYDLHCIFLSQIIDLKRDPYGTLDRRGKPTIKTSMVPKNPLQTMDDKLRIANKVNKKYKELMNELDDNIKEAVDKIGNEEATEILENRTKLASNPGMNTNGSSNVPPSSNAKSRTLSKYLGALLFDPEHILQLTVLYRKETKRFTQNLKDLMEKTQNPKFF